MFFVNVPIGAAVASSDRAGPRRATPRVRRFARRSSTSPGAGTVMGGLIASSTAIEGAVGPRLDRGPHAARVPIVVGGGAAAFAASSGGPGSR